MWLALLAHCSPPFAPPGLVDTFRVLGVQVEPAAVTRDEPATLTLVTADSQPRPVQVVWYRCGPPSSSDAGIGGGGVTDCRAATEIARGTPATVTLTGATRVALFACAGGAIEPPPAGARWPVCAGGVGWLATRNVPGRAPGSAPDSVARNAVVSEVRFGLADAPGEPLAPDAPGVVRRCEAARPAECPRLRLATALDTASREWLTARSARVTVRYAVDRGLLLGDTVAGSGMTESFDAEWQPPREAGTTVTLWITVADSRGGFGWTRRTLRVE